MRMKLTITMLTADKFEAEVTAEDKVKDIKVSIRVRSKKKHSALQRIY